MQDESSDTVDDVDDNVYQMQTRNNNTTVAEKYYKAYQKILTQKVWTMHNYWFKYTTCRPPSHEQKPYPDLPQTFGETQDMALSVVFKHAYDYYKSSIFETDETMHDEQIFETFFYKLLTNRTNFEDLFLICHGLEYFKVPASKLNISRYQDIETYLLELKTLFSFNNEKFVDFYFNKN